MDIIKSFDEFEYGIQMAFYWAAIFWYMKNVRKITDIEEYETETYIVAISNRSDNNECRVFRVGEQKITDNIERIETAIQTLIWHLSEDKWDHRKEYYIGDGTEEL